MAPRLSLANPLVTADQLETTPSGRDGVDPALEQQLRCTGCDLIQAAGILLGLPQVAMATAQVLVQRFYYVSSFTKFALRDTIMGALFLACKIEESPRKVKDIINVFDYVIKKKQDLPIIPLESFSPLFYDMKNGLTVAELQILKRLAFNVQVQLPYALLVNYLQCLGLTQHPRIPQMSWNYLNDGLRTNIYVSYQPPIIACAALFLAARQCQVKLPDQPPWWTVFDSDLRDLVNIAGHILSLYHTQPPPDIPLTLPELEEYQSEILKAHPPGAI
ncbi:cyclin-like protein [Dimargaris cristalligena]|uniref:Cyclin-like protein n=1 Tax=Dimargaris cristalligena TaxID=215637 RepID=A0A4V1J5C4_9FUNG|nr:cyclin-like protein [Dimargaris cristalligena]|eukprot:RKP38569.1 cyclin-like protein [Dimargaris cristalligena]